MNRITVNIPTGVCGSFEIRKGTGTFQEAQVQIYQSEHHGRWETEPFGTYTALWWEGFGSVMQDSAQEYFEHQPLWNNARGNILIGGLGIGLVNEYLVTKPEVTSVTIIEKYSEVIDLVWTHCAKDSRFTLVQADAETWTPPAGSHWDYAWFDTWLGNNPMNCEQYEAYMIGKYSPFCDKVEVWKNLFPWMTQTQ
jgi:hypothetical protein